MDNSSKAKSIELLQTTIAQLQGILEQINTASWENLPNPAELEKLLNSSKAIAKAIAPVKTGNQPLVVDRPEAESKSRLSVLLGSLIALVVVGVIVAILKFTPPQTTIEPAPEIVETSPPRSVTVTPSEPKPVNIPAPPPPKLEIIPEQGLIAAIQTEVSEITSRYSEDLIRFVEADFLASLLTIQLGENWYQLTPTQQQTMADQILERSQILNFRKLELRDSEGVVLGRSPVVGKSMVLLT
ncbi:hypothetical protein [Gloeocapsa sp. PCC 73106]|uniref:hypothetical protein n=1 Tax=Gloeocapsa sp. PCC 73106 TaxID=102232 RepID=UPI0002AD0444|nr:hypothetical protein [Gloeocapsa sp. PCC 73106]ELR98176.1 hypothetical protein GLO73106DRAFT_00020030 [Gloeocapsa sp. PCC 73106]